MHASPFVLEIRNRGWQDSSRAFFGLATGQREGEVGRKNKLPDQESARTGR
jgi:hypothetical protein